jgi:hypothetical protein
MSGEAPKRSEGPADETTASVLRTSQAEDCEDKALILARRRMLIASALVGIATSVEGCDAIERRGAPRPCLKVPARGDGAFQAPCLAQRPVEAAADGGEGADVDDAHALGFGRDDAGVATSEGAGTDSDAPPTPCLRVRATPPDRDALRSTPRACLSMRAPRATPRPCLDMERPSPKRFEEDDEG